MENKLVLHDNTTLRNLPESEMTMFLGNFGLWLDKLLSLDGDKSVKRLETLLPIIKECALGLTQKELKEAFMMYVKGQFDIEPRDNYMTIIMFNRILNSYKDWKRTTKSTIFVDKSKATKEEIAEIMNKACNRVITEYLMSGEINGQSSHIYDYLDGKGLIDISPEEKKVIYERAKKEIFTKAQNKKAKSRQEFRSIKAKLTEIRETGKHHSITILSKEYALMGYFDYLKQKGININDLI